MGGGLLQLVAYGAQDAYITGNPHITFWKVLYKRHTNFAMEAMRVNFTGAPAYGQRSVVVVNRNADLMFRTYLEVTLPDTRASANGSATSVNSPNGRDVLWTAGGRRRLGYLLIQQVEIEIGGQVMDRHYGEWMYLWESLTSNFDQSVRLDQMIGSSAELAASTPASCQGRPIVMYVPLSFWFCRNPGLALPLIALQYHEVRLNFIFRQATDLVSSQYDSTPANVWPGGVAQAAQFLPKLKDAAVYIDYIYLDTDERRRFAQQSHEYLIDQLQFGLQQSVTSQTVRLDLTLNHPVKELVWVYQDARKLDCSLPATSAGAALTYTQPFSYDDIANRCRLQLNGQDRFDERYGDYFWKVQPYQHHSGGGFNQITGSQVLADGAPENTALVRVNPINVYSFSLAPEEHQPSGSCNFSRIDTATLVFDSITTGTVGVNSQTLADGLFPSKNFPYLFRMYAVNYNIFRVMSGMGGLAYSN
jgi:hypothetical protein